jgi:hypothetical protein
VVIADYAIGEEGPQVWRIAANIKKRRRERPIRGDTPDVGLSVKPKASLLKIITLPDITQGIEF